MMKKNTFLYILILVLAVANGIFIYLFLNNPDKKPVKPDMFIAGELNFNSKQVEEFQVLNEQFQQKMRQQRHSLKPLKDAFFGELRNDNTSQKTLDSIATLIGEKEKEKDLFIYKYLNEVKGICTEKQKKHFDRIILDAMHEHGKKGGARPPKRK